MDALLPDIRNWFLEKQEYFAAFAEADSRIKGWFKAELIVLLNRLTREGKIDGFERECSISGSAGQRNQIDFRLHHQGQAHLCELKAICISQAAGTPRNLHFYFRDDQVGIIKDMKKLDELPGHEGKWILAFVYPAPDSWEWKKALAALPQGLGHWRCLTSPQDYPPFTYFALWKQG
jgi:hypothetical protein